MEVNGITYFLLIYWYLLVVLIVFAGCAGWLCWLVGCAPLVRPDRRPGGSVRAVVLQRLELGGGSFEEREARGRDLTRGQCTKHFSENLKQGESYLACI